MTGPVRIGSDRPRAAPAAVLLLAALLALAVANAVARRLPADQGADEAAHVAYAEFLRTQRRLPDLRHDDVFQAQHPPLYHACLAALGACGVPRSARRVTGLGFLALLAGAVAWAAWTARGDRLLNAWAGAAFLLVPQVAISFATPNNDQFAFLFSALGWCVLVSDSANAPSTDGGPTRVASARGDHPSLTRTVWAGVFLGFGMLSKLSVVGAVVAAAVYVAALPRAAGSGQIAARIRGVVALCTGPLVIAGWWIVRQIVTAGSLNATDYAAAHHTQILRATKPDGAALLDVTGEWLRSWVGLAGDRLAAPPTPLVWIGAVVLPLLALGCAVALRDAATSAYGRAVAAAVLAGLAAMTALLLAGNKDYFWVHGRHLHVLLVPAALAWPVAAAAVCGARAGAVTVGLAAVMAAAGAAMVGAL